MLSRKINIAIDGLSGCGKSSTAKSVAKKLGLIYLDTGAMYRAVTLYFQKNNIDLNNSDEINNSLPKIHIEIRYSQQLDSFETYLNGINVESEIRSSEVAAQVSQVSAVALVREYLVRQQQEIAQLGGVIMDGRDIGTVVMPNAELKIFMTASASVRAKRRGKELLEKGIAFEIDEVLQNLIDRDKTDSERKINPLRKAEDSIEIDTSNITFEQQVEMIVKKAKNILDN